MTPLGWSCLCASVGPTQRLRGALRPRNSGPFMRGGDTVTRQERCNARRTAAHDRRPPGSASHVDIDAADRLFGMSNRSCRNSGLFASFVQQLLFLTGMETCHCPSSSSQGLALQLLRRKAIVANLYWVPGLQHQYLNSSFRTLPPAHRTRRAYSGFTIYTAD